MPRIRTIKPEFPHSESMGKVSREARLLFILMWTLADDVGRLRGQPKMLASLLFPYDADAAKHMDGWLSELDREQCLTRYSVDGNSYIQILNWTKHQKIDRPSQSKFPNIPIEMDQVANIREPSRAFASNRESSTNPREPSSEDQGRDQGRDQGVAPQAPLRKPAAQASTSTMRPDDIPEGVWSDFLAIRKARKAPVTPRVLEGIRSEATKANWTLEAALKECVLRGWQGFKAEWVNKPAMATSNGRTFVKEVQHMPNMPLGTAACFCAGCVQYRSRREVTT